MFFFLKKIKLYTKNKLKYDDNIKIDSIILLKSLSNKVSKLFMGKKPPEEIIVIDKLNESKVLKFINFRKTKIINVIDE